MTHKLYTYLEDKGFLWADDKVKEIDKIILSLDSQVIKHHSELTREDLALKFADSYYYSDKVIEERVSVIEKELSDFLQLKSDSRDACDIEDFSTRAWYLLSVLKRKSGK